MSLACSVKFCPHSVTSDQVQAVITQCNKDAFHSCLQAYATRTDQGRTDWLITYYSNDPAKARIPYAVVTLKLNAQGHTLGFALKKNQSLFNHWVNYYLLNELARQLNGVLRAELSTEQAPDAVSMTLPAFLSDGLTQGMPHHMVTSQAGSFPPEFPFKDNWQHALSISGTVTGSGSKSSLEANKHSAAPPQEEASVPG